MKWIIDLDAEKCSSCGACAIACMDQNDIDVETEAPFRNVYILERQSKGARRSSFLSVACMHCTDAPCVQACPTGCLYKDEETGLTLYDANLCIGCHSCSVACPFGAPKFSAQGRLKKCDGCHVRLKCGMEPACVRVCPTGALKVYDAKTYEKEKLDKSLHTLANLML